MCQKFMQVIHARALYDSDSQVYDIDAPLYPGHVDWFEVKITLNWIILVKTSIIRMMNY